MKKNVFKLLLCVGVLLFNLTIVKAGGCDVYSDSLCGINGYNDGYVEKESTMNINGKNIKWSYRLKGEEAFYLECLNPEDLIGNVHIPGEIAGNKVISINEIIADNMVSLSFSNNIKDIGIISGKKLESLNLIGIDAVGRIYADNLKQIILPKEGLPAGAASYFILSLGKNITIIYEEGTEKINNWFGIESSNATMIIPNTVKEIDSLMGIWPKELVIPSSVKKIKYDEVMVFPKSTTGIDKLIVYSMDLEFENVEFSDDLVIYCYKGSTTEKYAKENGIKYEYIDETKEVFLDNSKEQIILEKTAYKVRINSDINNFKNVIFIDGKLVDPKNYTVKSGSTIIEFSKDYISTLSNDSHKVDMAFTDGYVSTTFKITDKPEEVNIMKEQVNVENNKDNIKNETVEEKIENPKTGENSHMVLMLIIVSIISFIIILKKSMNIVKNFSY